MVHDEAGVPVEAAASLFGAGDETATDFFATSFDNVSFETNSPVQPRDSNTAANLFEAGPDETTSSIFAQTPHHQPQSGVSLSNHQEQNDSQGQSQVDYQSTGYQNERWQDEQGQWHDYDYRNGYTSTYDYASQQPSGAYAPQTNYSQQLYDYTQSSTDHAPAIPQPASQYDYSQRYTPQQPSQHPQTHQATYVNSHVSSQNANYANNLYNPYSVVSPPDVPPYGGPPIPSQNISDKKDVNAYRPATLNAYDPPILTKTRPKGRLAFSSVPTPYDPVARVQSGNAPPPPPRAQQYIKNASPPPSIAGERDHDPRSTSYVLGPMDWSQEQGSSASSLDANIHEGQAHETQQFPSDLESMEPLGTVVDEGAVSSSRRGEFSHRAVEPPVVHNHSVGDHEAISSYAYEGNATSSIAAAPRASLDSSRYTSSPEQSQVYGLDDQPFRDDRDPWNTAVQTVTPPPQTRIPPKIEEAPGATNASPDGSPGNQRMNDPYHPTHHSPRNSNDSHVRSTFSPSEPASVTPWNPYAPTSQSSRRSSTASTSHGSYDAHGLYNMPYNGVPEPLHDPYAPSSQPHHVQNFHAGPSYTGEYTPHVADLGQPQSGLEPTSDIDNTGPGNVLTAPTYAAYAPSPSLLGTNDPLGRAAARVPVISFGFGGKLVSCFHAAGQTASGFDVSLTARGSTDVQLRTLHEVIPPSAMDSSVSSYPGPLFSDPGTSSLSLARTVGVGTASNVKAKKALASQWLEERANEISSGVAYMPAGSQERFNSEGRLVLVRLLKAMVDNDGQLYGSPSVEWTVRAALVPRLESEKSSSSVDGLSSTDIPAYTSGLPDLNEASLAVYHLRASALDRIQEFLLRGERHQAYRYALDEKLWAHAMLIASSLDKQAWKEAVKEFLHSELSVKPMPQPSPLPKSTLAAPIANGRESLRVAYSLFAGHGAAAVQELIPPRATPSHKDSTLMPQTTLHLTPISPNFPLPTFTSNVPPEVLSKWHETAAMMAFSQTTGDSAALTALGDCLAANRWFEAAHACYLLSPRTSSLGGAGIPSVRVVLVGSESPASLRNFSKDLDVTLFSEVVEFALSLSPAKGQETFGGLPHLQAYKLVRAAYLAETGHVEAANRYCEAIGSVIRASTRGSPFYTPTFIGELKNLSDRLTAAPQLDKTASWISSKLSKPSLDTIGSWLEGRFSKLVVGEGEGGQEPDLSEQTQPTKEDYGPFSHYSTISSTTTSASPSPSPTLYGLNGMGTKPIASNASFGVHSNSNVQIDRASSAMDHLRPQVHRTSPVQRVASASAATTTFATNKSTQYAYEHGDNLGNEGTNGNDGQDVAWWGSNLQDGNGVTPTAATFYKVDEVRSDGNFVSLMDSHSPDIVATAHHQSSQQQSKDEVAEEEEEDLGFRNTTTGERKPGNKDESKTDAADKSQPPPKITEDKSEAKQKSSSWFGRWWGRSSEAATSGPIKAKLGEETSFYYDKELKRWVNKKAGGADAPAPPPPPPPPSRPRTASPASGKPPLAQALSSGAPAGPPPRPTSAAEKTLPSRRPPRVRSNLVPTEESDTPGSAPPSATNFDAAKAGPALAPPSGISRPKSSASKRNVRSRYVDVLQQ